MQTMRDAIEQKLRNAIAPEFIEVEDESHGHNVAPGAQSHFKVTIVATKFEGLSAVKRHQCVYALLAEELAGSVHALALHTYSPEQWQKLGHSPSSPACMGGSNRGSV